MTVPTINPGRPGCHQKPTGFLGEAQNGQYHQRPEKTPGYDLLKEDQASSCRIETQAEKRSVYALGGIQTTVEALQAPVADPEHSRGCRQAGHAQP